MSNVFPIGPPAAASDDDVQRALELLGQAPPEPVPAWYEPERARIDSNFALVDEAFAEKPPEQPHRSASRARVDPDDVRIAWTVLALTIAFATAAFVASFAGQYAMAENTYLPSYLRFLVPLFIDLPIVVLSVAVLVFRRRGDSAVTSWVMIGGLTALSSAINVIHVLSEAGTLSGAPLTLETIVGATVMGLAPILVLVSWEEIGRLAVQPNPEKG